MEGCPRVLLSCAEQAGGSYTPGGEEEEGGYMPLRQGPGVPRGDLAGGGHTEGEACYKEKKHPKASCKIGWETLKNTDLTGDDANFLIFAHSLDAVGESTI